MTYGQDYGQPDQNPQQRYGQQGPQYQGPPQYQPQSWQQEQQDAPWQPREYDPSAHQQRIAADQYTQQGQSRPPQGQTWPQPGYGQPSYPDQPSYRGQSQYAPGPPQRQRRRRRHTVRNVLAGIGGLVVVIIGVSVAASSGGHTVNTSGTSTSGTGTSTSGTGTSGGGTAAKTAKTGSAIALSGNSSGEQMAVTVTKVIATAQPGDEFTSAPAGDRLYAVQFRLRDTSSAAYSDSPSNGAAVVDSAGQSYDAGLADTAAGCPSFPGSENIAPGSSGLGCIVFEVPKSAKITEVQFTLDSGMGPQTGQWNVG